MASNVSRREFRTMLSPGAALLLPGVANALAARIVADQGFAAAYVTGAGIANTFLGVPDIGLVTVTELAEHVAAIRAVFPGPLVVDADTGFGNPLNMVRTVELLERAGADALQIEDQLFPKKCGHFEGKGVISAKEMVQKVHAAVDARSSEDLLIIARTDARAVSTLEEALERAENIAHGVAQLAVSFHIGLEDFLAEPQVLRVIGGGHPKAQDVSAGLLDHLLRGDDVAEGF